MNVTNTHFPRGRLLRQVPDNIMDNCAMGAFCHWLNEKHQLAIHDYSELWQWSVANIEQFWQAIIGFFDLKMGNASPVLANAKMPNAQWLPNALLSYPEHVLKHRGDQTALVGISQSRARTCLSRDELRQQVAHCAQGLKRLGVKRGDRVAAYLPNIPEANVAFLATASLGAIWVSCAPEFGAKAVIDRFCQVSPKVLIAVAGYTYGDKVQDRRDQLSEICRAIDSITAVVDVPYQQGLQIKNASSWQQLLGHDQSQQFEDSSCEDLGFEELGFEELGFEKVPFSHPLYIVFSSGTTGLPKAIVHGHGGILLEHCKALGLHNDIGDGDSYFWFSTTGWMVWNYNVSALIMGAKVVCFDGNPMWPNADTLWQLAEQEQLAFFGNSATFYMSCRSQQLTPAVTHNLSAIRTLGSTGSTLPVEGFDWVYEQFGTNVVLSSAAGGTDICSAFVSASPMVNIRAGEIACPMLGVAVAAIDDNANEVIGEPGELIIKEPMPSMPVCFWGDDGSRLNDAYYQQNPGVWTHGDWIVIFDDGACVITGRSDSTLNRGGVRLGSADFYSVVEEISAVADSLVIHLEDNSGGMGQLILFVVAAAEQAAQTPAANLALEQSIKQALKNQLSPRHIPDQIVWLSAIPRTLTGKKLETPVKKLLKGVAINKVANRESLLNAHSLDEILAWQQTTLNTLAK